MSYKVKPAKGIVAKYACVWITNSQEQVSGQIPDCSPLNINNRLEVDLDQCAEWETILRPTAAAQLVLFTAVQCSGDQRRGKKRRRENTSHIKQLAGTTDCWRNSPFMEHFRRYITIRFDFQHAAESTKSSAEHEEEAASHVKYYFLKTGSLTWYIIPVYSLFCNTDLVICRGLFSHNLPIIPE